MNRLGGGTLVEGLGREGYARRMLDVLHLTTRIVELAGLAAWWAVLPRLLLHRGELR